MSQESGAGQWARHYQEAWQERSGDRRLPRWFRVVCLAYGAHDNGGHARFDQGEIALILGTVNHETGELVPLPRQRVHDAIRQAVELSFLADGSVSRCLVVPAHDVKKGPLEDGGKPCPIHVKKVRASRKNRDISAQTSGSNRDVSDQTSHPQRDVSGSTPSLCSVPRRATDGPPPDDAADHATKEAS